ncbi:MAG TPA: glycosyltransferase, partial [Dissulfuribacter thermophilus]|nr:glycosyltransferase [Dissulfuribacter thermophilus]
DSVSLPGFIPNPYPFLLRADLFVLSSLWEGSPNALTEAMALGVPVVSTDCPSGPREILKGGEFGPLVPLKAPCALAKAMEETLRNPPEKKALMDAVRDYTVERSSKRYLEILLGRPLD